VALPRQHVLTKEARIKAQRLRLRTRNVFGFAHNIHRENRHLDAEWRIVWR
jgi:hypothetical protein